MPDPEHRTTVIVVRQPDLKGLRMEKRFYVPGAVIESDCPACGKMRRHNTTVCDTYLSNPVSGEKKTLYFCCLEDACGEEWAVEFVVTISVIFQLPSPNLRDVGGDQKERDSEESTTDQFNVYYPNGGVVRVVAGSKIAPITQEGEGPAVSIGTLFSLRGTAGRAVADVPRRSPEEGPLVATPKNPEGSVDARSRKE